jgi:hypothetical protein
MAGVPKKQVSVSAELHLLMGAVRGIHALTRHWTESYGTEANLPHGISALLTVVVERLRLLDRVVRDTVDPRLFWCDGNDVSAPEIPRRRTFF